MPHPGMTSKAATNPIAEGAEGLATLRGMSECNIPEESKKLQAQVSLVLELEGDHEVAEIAMGKGLFAGLRMRQHCTKNLHTRIAVRFDGDERLQEIAKEVGAAEGMIEALQKEIQTVAENARKLIEERWAICVKSYGLNPDTKFYRILENEGIVEEIELRCDKCTAGQSMIDARLNVETYMAGLTKEEASNDGDTETGSTEKS